MENAAMTISELIAELSKFPPESHVWTSAESGIVPVESIERDKLGENDIVTLYGY